MSKSTTESQLAKILGTLGNKDAIKILRFAKNGFDATSDAREKLDLSVKQYYYRLSKLEDVNLVTKSDNRYELTPLGTVVCDSLERNILWAIENMDNLKIMETLKKSTVDEKTLERVAANLLGGDLQLGASVKIIRTYEELVNTVIELSDAAMKKYYLASRYSDIRAAEAGWRALQRGVKVRVIDGATDGFSGRMKMVYDLVKYPKLVKIFYELWHSENIQFRYRDIPFSFMVVNDTVCCMEILNPARQGFFLAIQIANDHVMTEKLTETFDNLWEQGAKEEPFVKLSEDLMRRMRK